MILTILPLLRKAARPFVARQTGQQPLTVPGTPFSSQRNFNLEAPTAGGGTESSTAAECHQSGDSSSSSSSESAEQRQVRHTAGRDRDFIIQNKISLIIHIC